MLRPPAALVEAITLSLQDDIAALFEERMRIKGDKLPTQLEIAAMERIQGVLRQALAALLIEMEMLQ